jgi:uncharacterized protein (UPF0297 family)
MTPKIYSEWNEEQIIAYIKERLDLVRMKDKNGKYKKGSNNTYAKVDIQIRRDYILGLFTKGYSKTKVRGYLREVFELSDASAYEWINDAIGYLTEDREETIEYFRGVARERLEDIYQKAMDNNEKKVAIQAQTELNKINGLHIDKHEISMDATMRFNFGNDGEETTAF